MEAPGIEQARDESGIVGPNGGLPEKTAATSTSEVRNAATVSDELEPPVPEWVRLDSALSAVIKAAVEVGDDDLALDLLAVRKVRRERQLTCVPPAFESIDPAARTR